MFSYYWFNSFDLYFLVHMVKPFFQSFANLMVSNLLYANQNMVPVLFGLKLLRCKLVETDSEFQKSPLWNDPRWYFIFNLTRF